MPKRCTIDVDIQRVSAPGVWLPSGEDVYLSISVFGQYRETLQVRAEFPLLFHERFRFEKTFYSARVQSDVADLLEDEIITIELLQLADYCSVGVRLAEFCTTVRDFLYPYPSAYPSYFSEYREMLLPRTVVFPDIISPKLMFTTRAKIEDGPLDRALEDLTISRRSRSRSRSLTRRSSLTRPRSLSLSDISRRSRYDTKPLYSTADYLDTYDYDDPVTYVRPRSRSPYTYRSSYTSPVRRSPSPAPLVRSRSLTRSLSPWRYSSTLIRSYDDLELDRLLGYRRYYPKYYYTDRYL